MITANGRIIKQAVCQHCFSIITWDNVDDEISTMGHRTVKCPVCGSNEEVDQDAIITKVDVIENPQAYLNNIAYSSAIQAVSNLNNGDNLILNSTFSLYDFSASNANIDFGGNKITITAPIKISGNTTLSNGIIFMPTEVEDVEEEQNAILVAQGATLTLNNVTIISNQNGIFGTNCTIVIKQSSISATKAAMIISQGTILEIDGGDYNSGRGNGIIVTKTPLGQNKNSIIINDGAFSSQTEEDDVFTYIAEVNHKDSFIIKKGVFEIKNGSAFIVRQGKLDIDPNVTIAISTSNTISGKVGQSDELIPSGYDIVIDYKSENTTEDDISIEAVNKTIYTIE